MKFNESNLDLNKSYTYADYLLWQFEERIELIKGKIFKMAPAPNTYHQIVSTRLFGKLWIYFEPEPCNVFTAPFDVRLPKPPHHKRSDNDIDSVVQPDITVICDLGNLDRKGGIGAPDWIIEIASPGTRKKDMTHKFELYEFSGVKEYWMVLPKEKEVKIYSLDQNGKYVAAPPYPFYNKVSSVQFPDLEIDLDDIFPEMNLVGEPWPEFERL